MAHKNLIICDNCKTKEIAEGAPYPEGWAIASVVTWASATASSPRTRMSVEKDLCPSCVTAVRDSLDGRDEPAAPFFECPECNGDIAGKGHVTGCKRAPSTSDLVL